MIYIKINNLNPNDLKKFYTIKNLEWSDIESSNKVGDIKVPEPLLAYVDEKMVGGLEFSSYHNPESKGITVWINAVIIQKDFRKKGIATLLINKAEEVLIKNGSKVGYVYTDKPKLYLKCGWNILEEVDEHFVMKKNIN